MVRIKEEDIEMVCNFGAFHYPSDKIAILLDAELSDVEKDMADENSELSKLLRKGRYKSEYAIDTKLFEMSIAGDIKALEKFNSRRNPLNKRNRK